MIHIEACADLPADAAALFGRDEFQLGAAWFAALAATALPAGAAPLWLLARAAGQAQVGQVGRVRVVLPLWRDRDGGLAGLTTPYTSVFRPLVAADVTATELAAAGRGFARFCRRHGPLRLDALDADWPGLAPLLAGFRAGGMPALRFAHFGNWYLDVAGLGWEAYLAGRPGELRHTIRRRLAQAGRDRGIGFGIVRGGADLAGGIAAYAAAYAQSWKAAEPWPLFPAALMRAAAAAGVLRLGLLHAGGVPVAAQLWLVAGGVATVHKLAHDERARRLSPGTVLTALMIRHLLETERVTTLDFGRGDDPYKVGWTGQRRARIGVVLCPPWQRRGAALLARHLAGRLRQYFAGAARIG